MAQNRVALIIAIEKYEDPALQALTAPAAVAAELADTLGHARLRAFAVEVVRNEPAATVLQRLDDFLTDRKTSDFAVVHFSGHGVKDDSGELYLAATNTIPNR